VNLTPAYVFKLHDIDIHRVPKTGLLLFLQYLCVLDRF